MRWTSHGKKVAGSKSWMCHCQERATCATVALCRALLLAAPRIYNALLFQKIRGLFDSSTRLRWKCSRASLPSLDSSWVKAAKAEDGSQPSRQSCRVAHGQGLANYRADSNLWLNTMSVYLFIQLTTPVLESVLIDGSDCYSVWFCYMAIDALTAIQRQKDLVLSCTWRLLIGSPTQPDQFVNLTASLAL